MLSFESKIYPNIVSNLKLVASNMQVKQTQTRGSTEKETLCIKREVSNSKILFISNFQNIINWVIINGSFTDTSSD